MTPTTEVQALVKRLESNAGALKRIHYPSVAECMEDAAAMLEALLTERDALAGETIELQEKNLRLYDQNTPDFLALSADLTAAKQEIERLTTDLRFVERWVNHHARKPSVSVEDALATIQHYPAITAITRSYADGVIPDTVNPWADLAAARQEIERLRVVLEQIASHKWGYASDAIATAKAALEQTP